jgi:hypothetical protein
VEWPGHRLICHPAPTSATQTKQPNQLQLN